MQISLSQDAYIGLLALIPNRHPRAAKQLDYDPSNLATFSRPQANPLDPDIDPSAKLSSLMPLIAAWATPYDKRPIHPSHDQRLTILTSDDDELECKALRYYSPTSLNGAFDYRPLSGWFDDRPSHLRELDSYAEESHIWLVWHNMDELIPHEFTFNQSKYPNTLDYMRTLSVNFRIPPINYDPSTNTGNYSTRPASRLAGLFEAIGTGYLKFDKRRVDYSIEAKPITIEW